MMYRDPFLLMLSLGWAEAEAESSWYKQKTEASQGAQAPQDSVVSGALHWSGAVSFVTTAQQRARATDAILNSLPKLES